MKYKTSARASTTKKRAPTDIWQPARPPPADPGLRRTDSGGRAAVLDRNLNLFQNMLNNLGMSYLVVPLAGNDPVPENIRSQELDVVGLHIVALGHQRRCLRGPHQKLASARAHPQDDCRVVARGVDDVDDVPLD